ncbi:MAG: hypothetical protein HY273_03285 [Gammaproteobacteria bacterium]|nr:hypothetical protein [Gammaproteobacteria bacterium]
MYEPKTQRILTHKLFIRRVVLHFAASLGLLLFSLALGIAGRTLRAAPVARAFLNSAMLLGGMGPVDSPKTDGGKLFAGFYALYAGLVFLVTVGLVLAPVVHRIMHKFHWEQDR